MNLDNLEIKRIIFKRKKCWKGQEPTLFIFEIKFYQPIPPNFAPAIRAIMAAVTYKYFASG